MFWLTKLCMASLGVGMALVVTGCVADNKPPQSSLVSTPEGLTCSKCQVTWVKYPVTAGGGKGHRIVSYRTRKSMECPDCKDAVQNFFAAGKFQHTCKTCGESMEICEAH